MVSWASIDASLCELLSRSRGCRAVVAVALACLHHTISLIPPGTGCCFATFSLLFIPDTDEQGLIDVLDLLTSLTRTYTELPSDSDTPRRQAVASQLPFTFPSLPMVCGYG